MGPDNPEPITENTKTVSTQGTVVDFLRSLHPEAGSVIAMTPNTLSMQTGIGKSPLRRTLYSLKQQGKIDFEKDESGREIAGIKVIDLEPKTPGRKPATKGEKYERMRLATPKVTQSSLPRRRGALATPSLDAYAKAKAEFERITSQWAEWGSASFNENALAEEGLAMKAAYESVVEQLSMLRTEHADLNHDYDSLVAKKRQGLAQKAEANGAMAISSTD